MGIRRCGVKRCIQYRQRRRVITEDRRPFGPGRLRAYSRTKALSNEPPPAPRSLRMRCRLKSPVTYGTSRSRQTLVGMGNTDVVGHRDMIGRGPMCRWTISCYMLIGRQVCQSFSANWGWMVRLMQSGIVTSGGITCKATLSTLPFLLPAA